MSSPRKSSEPRKVRSRPPTTPEALDNRLINLASNQAELQLIEGTAPAPVVLHFLKMGTERYKLEQEKLRRENLLLERKAEQIESSIRVEELYSEAINAMRRYQGIEEEITEEDDLDGY